MMWRFLSRQRVWMYFIPVWVHIRYSFLVFVVGWRICCTTFTINSANPFDWWWWGSMTCFQLPTYFQIPAGVDRCTTGFYPELFRCTIFCKDLFPQADDFYCSSLAIHNMAYKWHLQIEICEWQLFSSNKWGEVSLYHLQRAHWHRSALDSWVHLL